ncbi:MAG TPA: hypothetical protein VFR94_00700 [Nitrososphaeraceae archaeon]|nr:hypothetical protein [Nitrososphaeraceae archaeon]
MLKIDVLGVISVIIILSFAILPQLTFGQTPTLDKLSIENSQSPQCLDFNQDTICEFMVIANGTMVKNPSLDGQTTLTPAANLTVTATTPETNPKPILPPPLLTIVTPQSPRSYSAPSTNLQSFVPEQTPTYSITEGKCLGMGVNYCRNLVMPDYSVVPNPNFIPGQQQQVQTQTVEEEPADSGSGSGSGRPPSDNPYCDLVRDDYQGDCFDRRDYDQETGLYPCRDGSDVKDWRDCPDGPEANSNSNSGSDDEDEEAAADDLPQEGGCQEGDDFCDADEGCRSDDVDCIDDRGFDEDDYNG